MFYEFIFLSCLVVGYEPAAQPLPHQLLPQHLSWGWPAEGFQQRGPVHACTASGCQMVCWTSLPLTPLHSPLLSPTTPLHSTQPYSRSSPLPPFLFGFSESFYSLGVVLLQPLHSSRGRGVGSREYVYSPRFFPFRFWYTHIVTKLDNDHITLRDA